MFKWFTGMFKSKKAAQVDVKPTSPWPRTSGPSPSFKPKAERHHSDVGGMFGGFVDYSDKDPK